MIILRKWHHTHNDRRNILKNSKILITGGTGSFGKRMLTYLLRSFEFKKIIIFSRDEQKHHRLLNTLENKQKSKVRFFIGNVRD